MVHAPHFSTPYAFFSFDLQAPRWTQVATKSSHNSAEMCQTVLKMDSETSKIASKIQKTKKQYAKCRSSILFIWDAHALLAAVLLTCDRTITTYFWAYKSCVGSVVLSR